jgi:hypothetical protein
VTLYQDIIRQKDLMNKAGRNAYIAALTTGKDEVVPDMIIDDQQRRT